MDRPETRYAKTADGHSIAYQVFGTGSDSSVRPGVHLEPRAQLGPSRVRGPAPPTRIVLPRDRRRSARYRTLRPALARRCSRLSRSLMEDLGRVLDEVGSERATVVGLLDGGYLCMLFAATHPERTRALVLYGTSASGKWSLDYPWQWKPNRWESYFDEMAAGWGRQEYARDGLGWYAPSAHQDEATRRWWGRYQRLAASPGSAIALERLYSQTDVRHILPSIRVPTLVLHRRGDPVEPVEGARYIARADRGSEVRRARGGRCPAVGGRLERHRRRDRGVPHPWNPTIAGAGPRAPRPSCSPTSSVRPSSSRWFADGPWKDLLARHNELAKAEIQQA